MDHRRCSRHHRRLRTRYGDRVAHVMDGIAGVQLVTRSTIEPPNSFTVSKPSVTAVDACCATSLATRVTRAIGDCVAFCPPLELRFALPLRFAAAFLMAGRFAALF